jgi:hypothetical protein
MPAGLPSTRGKALLPLARAGLLSWFVPPVLAGEVAREAAAERDAVLAAAGGKVPRRRARLLLCVPKTSSTSCDQAIFVDQASDVSLFPDVVVVEIDRLG